MCTDRQTDRQNDYCNPRCACAPRVNYAHYVAQYMCVQLTYPKLGFSDQKAVHKVDNVLLPDLLHHNNLIDDQLLHVPGGGRKGPIDQR